jgi:quinol monooxygenase YgiN
MVHATVTVVARPPHRAGVLQALCSLLSPTRVEPGCVRCQLYEDVEEPGSFALVEEWATPTDFERRLRSEAYRHLLMLMELSAEPPGVWFRVVSHTMGMEAIHAARGR